MEHNRAMTRSSVTILDGAMGTELKARGAAVPDYRSSAWSAVALVRDPDTVKRVHRDYIEAGAGVVTVNNYAVVPRLLSRVGMSERFEELTLTACHLARAARDEAGRSDVLIAGSLPPLDTTYRPDLVPAQAELDETYARIAHALAGAVDLALAETLTTAREAVAAARAAERAGLKVWVSWNLSLDAAVLRSGESLTSAVRALDGLPVQGFLVNCIPTAHVREALRELRAATDRPIGAYANSCANAPDQDALDACTGAILGPEDYADVAATWVAAGATLIGGCCDTKPAHIAALACRWGAGRAIHQP
jgi:S-methylmethionine-dependent homocysteine/selenocysteine methylase